MSTPDGDMTAEVQAAKKNYTDDKVFTPSNPSDGISTANEFYRKLRENGEVVIEHGGDSYTSYTNLAGPDWYNRHVKGREELLGWGPKNIYDLNDPATRQDYTPQYEMFFRPPPIPVEQSIAMADALAKHWENVEEHDPELSYLYQIHPMLLFGDAELAAREGGNPLIADMDTTTRTGAFFTGDSTSPYEYEALEDTLRMGENFSWFLDDYQDFFNATEMDFIGSTAILTDVNRREWMASMARNWWEDGERDINNPGDRTEFLNWWYGLGKNAQNQSFEERGAWNVAAWNVVDAGFGTFQFKDFLRRNLIPNFKRLLRGDETDWTPGNRGWMEYFDMNTKYDPANYQYTGSVPDPKQWAYESNLTSGQQVAASFGWNVEDKSWAVASTLVDGALYVATPGDMAIALATGGTSTAAKIARVGMEDISKLGRVRLAAKASIPIFGRKWASKQATSTLPRGVFNRVGWALRSKNQAQFFEAAASKGVVRRWFKDWAEHGIGKVIDENPNLVPLVDSGFQKVLDDAVLADDYEAFEYAMRQATFGAADDTAAETVEELTKRRAKLQEELRDEADRAMRTEVKAAGLRDDTVALSGDMMDWAVGNHPQGMFAYIDEGGNITWADEMTNPHTSDGWDALRQMIDDEPDSWYFIKERPTFDVVLDPDATSPASKAAYQDFINKLRHGGALFAADEVPPLYRLDTEFEFVRLSEKVGDPQDISFAKDWVVDTVIAKTDAKKLSAIKPSEGITDPTEIVVHDMGTGETFRNNEGFQRFRIRPKLGESSLSDRKLSNILDIGETPMLGPDGEPLKRFNPVFATNAGFGDIRFDSRLQEASFDTLDEAVQYLFQFNADIKVNQNLLLEGPSGTGANYFTDMNITDPIDKADLVRDWFKGGMAGDPDDFVELLEQADDTIPLVTSIMGSKYINSGSAFTRSMDVLKKLFDPNVPLRTIATDNVAAVQNSILSKIIQAIDLDVMGGGIKADDILSGLSEETAVRAHGMLSTERRKELRPFIEQMAGKLDELGTLFKSNGVRRIDDLYVKDPELLDTVRAWFDDLTDDQIDFLLNNQTPDLGWKSNWHPKVKGTENPDASFFEPYLINHENSPLKHPYRSDMHVLEEGPQLMSDRMLERMHQRFIVAMGYYFENSIVTMLSDPATRTMAENALAKMEPIAGDNFHWFDLLNNEQARLHFAGVMLDEWGQVQEAFKRALHYKADENPMIPLFRAGSMDSPNRLTSYATGNAWDDFMSYNDTAVPKYGYARMNDIAYSGPERVLKVWMNSGSHFDISNEMIATPSKLIPVDQVGYRYRAARQTQQGVDVERLVKDYFKTGANAELVEPKLRTKFDMLDSRAVNGQLREGQQVGGEGYKFKVDGVSVKQFENPEKRLEFSQIEAELNKQRALNGLSAVVYDVPDISVPWKRNLGEFFGGMNGSATGTERQVFSSAYRRTRSRVFSPGLPQHIDITDMEHATYEVRRVLTALGASKPLRSEMLSKWAMAPVSKKGDVIEEIFQRVGKESGNPMLEHMFGRAIKNSRMRRSSATADTAGWAEDLGQTRQGVVSPTPSHGGTKFVLPDESLFKMMSRWRKSGVLPDWTVKGLKGETNARRANIVEALRNKVGPEVAEELGEDGLLRMAYAMVAPSGQPEWDGVGAIAKWMEKGPGRAWNFVHGTFSRMVLTLQPWRWMLKVAAIEEPIRGALMGMPNLLMDPFSAGRDLIHAFNVSKYDNLAAKFDDIMEAAMERFANADDADELWSAIGALEKKAGGPAVYREELAAYLKRAISEDDLAYEDFGNLAGAIRQNRRDLNRLVQIEEGNIARGLRPDFTWDDVPEIVSKSMFSEFVSNVESAGPLTYSPNDTANLPRFTRAWSKELVRAGNDPFLRLAGEYMYASPSQKDDIIRRFGNLKEWPHYKENARAILEHKLGTVPKNLEKEYLAHLGEHVDRLFKPFAEASEDPYGAWKSVTAGKWESPTIGESIYVVNLRDEKGLAQTLGQLIEGNKADPSFNSRVPGFLDTPYRETFVEHGSEAQFKGKNKSLFKRYTDWALRNFGERATQVLNRRPAYLWKYNSTYDGLIRLGVDDALAKKVSHRKAFEAVNYVYFNQDHIPPLIRKMNRVVPFFGAQFEILGTWLHKIPFAQGAFFSPLTVVRKIDKMFAGLANSGLLDVTYTEGDEDFGGKPVARYSLSFDPEGSKADSVIGQVINNVGVTMHTGVLQSALWVRNLLHEEDVDLGDLEPDNFSLAWGNPLDWSRQNQGVLAINSLFITPTPGAKPAIDKLMQNINFAARNDLVEGGGKLSVFVVNNDTERARFLVENRTQLVEAWGLEQYQKVLDNGSLDPVLPKVPLYLPGTSWYDTFVQPWLYPMGYPEDSVYTWTEFIPSTLRMGMRAIGIGQGVSDPESWWMMNEDGTQDTVGALTTLMLPTAQDRYLASGQVKTAMQNYEAQTGALTRYSMLSGELERIMEAAMAENVGGFDDDGNPLWDEVGTPYEKEWNNVKTELDMLWNDIMSHSFRDAASAMGLRGMVGFLSPVTPRWQYDEEQAISNYYAAKDNAENGYDSDGRPLDENGMPNLFAQFDPMGTLDTDEFNDLYRAFLEDDTNKEAKQILKDRMPELWAHAFGKSYWGAAGVPAEVQSLDDFFDQIASGERQPFDPVVQLQRIARAHVAASREASIINNYGDDPVEAAAAILNDWAAYRENVSDPASRSYDALDWYDDISTDGKYLEWVERGEENDVFTAEITRRTLELQENVDELEALLPSYYTGNDLKENASTLSAISAKITDAVDALGKEYDQYGVRNERDRIINWYFESQVGAYYGKLGALYDKLDSVETDREASYIYDQIRQVNDEYSRPVQYGFHGLPSVQDWRWGRMSEEEQSNKLMDWVDNPIDWLGADQIARMRQELPNLENVLPMNANQYQLFQNYAQARNEINALADFNPETGERWATEYEARQARKRLEQELRGRLYAGGMGDMVEYMDMWPIERFGLTGMLPAAVEPLAGEAMNFRKALAANDKTTSSQQGLAIADQIYTQHLQTMRNNPEYSQFFRMLGQNLYGGEIDGRMIFNIFVLGEYWKA